MVCAARACGVDVYDTPFTDVEDTEGLYADARFAKSLGFTGKASISPRHVEGINEVFSPTQAEIDYARTRLVVAARAANVDVYDTPFTDVNDDEGIRTDAEYAKALGFTGKASISPRHVEVINEVFSPTQADIDYAYEVMDAIRIAKEQGRGAIALRGKMIDAPIVARAQQTIAMAEEMAMRRGGKA